MKKYRLFVFAFLAIGLFIACFRFLSHSKTEAQLLKCIDGDTVHLEINGVDEKVRFLAIDTPEIMNPEKNEPFGEETAAYTCKALQNAGKITLEFEKNAQRDQYGRLLAWVFVDERLLQEELVEMGYAQVKYVYDDYRYVNVLKRAQERAKLNQAGIWK